MEYGRMAPHSILSPITTLLPYHHPHKSHTVGCSSFQFAFFKFFCDFTHSIDGVQMGVQLHIDVFIGFTEYGKLRRTMLSFLLFPYIPGPDFLSLKHKYNKQGMPEDSLGERIQKMQGNLKLIEKQYKLNLKEGFEHKIKAYRLQAVVERKLMKEAISFAQRSAEEEARKQLSERAIKQRQMEHLRAIMLQKYLQDSQEAMKDRFQTQKRNISLSLKEKSKTHEESLRQMHDRIMQDERHVDRRRKYIEYSRKTALKKEEAQLKQIYVEKISRNTQRLRELKDTLTSMSSGRDPFLTL